MTMAKSEQILKWIMLSWIYIWSDFKPCQFCLGYNYLRLWRITEGILLIRGNWWF